VIECAIFDELQRESWSQSRFLAPANQAVHLDMDFLEFNGDIMSTRPVLLAAGASASFSMLTRHVGSAIQVIASGSVEVAAILVYDDGAGQAVRKTVPCMRTLRPPARGGGL
jgi:hypothetical protein